MRRRLPAAAALLLGTLLAGCGAAEPAPAPAAPPPDPDRARTIDLLRGAKHLESEGDGAGAEAAWEEVLRLRPGNTLALYSTARLRRGRGDLAGALERLRELRDAEPQASRGFLLAAEILSEPSAGPLRDSAAAEALARGALERNPEESGPFLVLGRVLMLAGRAPEAGEVLEVAARMNPRDAESRSLRGVLHLREGLREEAVRWFREALSCAREAGVGALHGGVAGEGDTLLSLSPGGRPSAGELRAAAGLGAAGARAGTGVAEGVWEEGVRAEAERALAARGTGEAVLDRDGDGAPDAAFVEGEAGPAGAIHGASGVRILR